MIKNNDNERPYTRFSIIYFFNFILMIQNIKSEFLIKRSLITFQRASFVTQFLNFTYYREMEKKNAQSIRGRQNFEMIHIIF